MAVPVHPGLIMWDGSEPRRRDVPLATVADGKTPLLRYLLDNEPEQARSYKIEWLVDTPKREAWCNYTQIVRTPWRELTERNYWRKLDEHLADIEAVLWHGVPSYNTSDRSPVHTCGGVLHYLGRAPVKCDYIRLWLLRDLAYRETDNRNGFPVAEFITEFSLSVEPANPLVRVPSNHDLPFSWAEGSSLEDGPAA